MSSELELALERASKALAHAPHIEIARKFHEAAKEQKRRSQASVQAYLESYHESARRMHASVAAMRLTASLPAATKPAPSGIASRYRDFELRQIGRFGR